MISLIHGDDLERIEKTLIDLTLKSKIVRIDGVKIKKKELEEILLGGSLFGEESLFVIDSLYKSKNKKELLEFISIHKDSLTAILVERSKITKRDLGLIKADSVSEFALPQYYFKFLDEIYPGNSKSLDRVYRELLKTMGAEQIFYSVIKRVRALIAVRSGANSHSEIVRFAPWQLGKLRQQASFWREEDLVAFYNKLFEIEKKMKSSALPLGLEKYLDIMLITELN